MVQVFISSLGPERHNVNYRGQNPLFHAVKAGQLEYVKLLLRKGLLLVQDHRWLTPLHVAAMGSNYDILKVLCETKNTCESYKL